VESAQLALAFAAQAQKRKKALCAIAVVSYYAVKFRDIISCTPLHTTFKLEVSVLTPYKLEKTLEPSIVQVQDPVPMSLVALVVIEHVELGVWFAQFHPYTGLFCEGQVSNSRTTALLQKVYL
jgi:hypothetical protein